MSIRYRNWSSRGLDMPIRATHSGCWCKICGVTSVEEAVSIADLGADSIGLNFYSQSPRYLSKKKAAEIAASTKNFTLVSRDQQKNGCCSDHWFSEFNFTDRNIILRPTLVYLTRSGTRCLVSQKF